MPRDVDVTVAGTRAGVGEVDLFGETLDGTATSASWPTRDRTERAAAT